MTSVWSEVRNVLVMRLDNIGDVILTSPALRALREHLPAARLTLMCSPSGAQAAPLLPWLDDLIEWRALWQDLGRLPHDPDRERQLFTLLREREFDAAVILTSFSQTPHAAAYACAAAGIPLRAGQSKERGSCLTDFVPAPPDALHQAERNLHLLEGVGIPVHDRSLGVTVPSAPREHARWLLRELGVYGPYVLLSPFTTAQARTYPEDRFAEAARLTAAQTGLPVVVTGTERDRERAAPILQALGPDGADALGRSDLLQFAALVEGASVVLCGNTSTLHLADALRVPVVSPYSGAELESQWTPRDTRHVLLRRETPCSPCHQFTCPYDRECMDIDPAEIAAHAQAMLRQEEVRA